MKLVIDIPEGLKKDFELEQWTALSCMEMKDALMNGTPLPKGHNENNDYAECDQFVCSECGIELQDWHRVERDDDGEVSYHEYTFRYCPNCGAIIGADGGVI